jgi:RNA polymerase sigma-70 factor (ECF subfamily)
MSPADMDVFVRMWETREKMSIHTSVRGYLYTAVKNSCLNQIKHSRFSAPLEGKEERPDLPFVGHGHGLRH